MLRIHLTGEDLGRVRLATQADPLWETVLSLSQLGRPDASSAFNWWRREAVRRSHPAALAALMPLTPSGGDFPEVLYQPEAVLGPEAGIEAVLAAFRRQLSDGTVADGESPMPGSGLPTELAGPERAALEQLGAALRAYHRAAIAPYWSQIQAQVDADRAKRSQALLKSGSAGLLDSYRPIMRWRSPVLEVELDVEEDIQLHGQGLVLVPSFFCGSTPDVFENPTLPPVLVYPITHDAADPARNGSRAGAEALAALIGHTRAAVLGVVAAGCTTTELARRVGVSAGAISQHTAVLREAGLICTTRTGKAVVHTLTPLGAALLSGPVTLSRLAGDQQGAPVRRLGAA